MFQKITIIILSLVSVVAFGSGILINDGKIYDLNLVEKELNVCGELNSPTYLAGEVILDSAKGAYVVVHKSMCGNGSRKDCTNDDFARSGQKGVFVTIRRYPSQFKSEGCKGLRVKCEDECRSSGLFEAKTCIIECNQYETYNK